MTPPQFRWISKPAAGLWHALACHARGWQPAQPELWAALAPNFAQWQAFLPTQRVEPLAVAEHLVPLSVEYDTPRYLAEALLAKLFSADKALVRQAIWTTELAKHDRAHAAQFPKLATELPFRIPPIKELTEAQGPGLLMELTRTTAPHLLPHEIKVIVVQPYLGGHGRAYPLANSLVWEGMLVNAEPRLPEVLRLVWLAGQLNFDTPALAGELYRNRAILVGAWAMLPLTLAAAAELELAECTLELGRLAAKNWRLTLPGERITPETAVDIAWSWWETYAAKRPLWPIALGALSKMFERADGEGA